LRRRWTGPWTFAKDAVNRAASVLMADTAGRAGAHVRADLLHGSRLAAAGGQP
jgi:hypothetical protein